MAKQDTGVSFLLDSGERVSLRFRPARRRLSLEGTEFINWGGDDIAAIAKRNQDGNIESLGPLLKKSGLGEVEGYIHFSTEGFTGASWWLAAYYVFARATAGFVETGPVVALASIGNNPQGDVCASPLNGAEIDKKINALWAQARSGSLTHTEIVIAENQAISDSAEAQLQELAQKGNTITKMGVLDIENPIKEAKNQNPSSNAGGSTRLKHWRKTVTGLGLLLILGLAALGIWLDQRIPVTPVTQANELAVESLSLKRTVKTQGKVYTSALQNGDELFSGETWRVEIALNKPAYLYLIEIIRRPWGATEIQDLMMLQGVGADVFLDAGKHRIPRNFDFTIGGDEDAGPVALHLVLATVPDETLRRLLDNFKADPIENHAAKLNDYLVSLPASQHYSLGYIHQPASGDGA